MGKIAVLETYKRFWKNKCSLLGVAKTYTCKNYKNHTTCKRTTNPKHIFIHRYNSASRHQLGFWENLGDPKAIG